MSSVNTASVIRRFQKIPADVRASLVRTMNTIGFDLTGHIQQDKLQGQVLHHRTGNLSSHVHPQTTDDGTSVTTVVSIDSNAVPYARIHEYGGTVNRVSTRGKKFTAHYPERSYMRTGLADRRTHYVQMIDDAVRAGL